MDDLEATLKGLRADTKKLKAKNREVSASLIVIRGRIDRILNRLSKQIKD